MDNAKPIDTRSRDTHFTGTWLTASVYELVTSPSSNTGLMSFSLSFGPRLPRHILNAFIRPRFSEQQTVVLSRSPLLCTPHVPLELGDLPALLLVPSPEGDVR